MVIWVAYISPLKGLNPFKNTEGPSFFINFIKIKIFELIWLEIL